MVAGGIMFSSCPSVTKFVQAKYPEPVKGFQPNSTQAFSSRHRLLIRFWKVWDQGQVGLPFNLDFLYKSSFRLYPKPVEGFQLNFTQSFSTRHWWIGFEGHGFKGHVEQTLIFCMKVRQITTLAKFSTKLGWWLIGKRRHTSNASQMHTTASPVSSCLHRVLAFL